MDRDGPSSTLSASALDILWAGVLTIIDRHCCFKGRATSPRRHYRTDDAMKSLHAAFRARRPLVDMFVARPSGSRPLTSTAKSGGSHATSAPASVALASDPLRPVRTPPSRAPFGEARPWPPLASHHARLSSRCRRVHDDGGAVGLRPPLWRDGTWRGSQAGNRGSVGLGSRFAVDGVTTPLAGADEWMRMLGERSRLCFGVCVQVYLQSTIRLAHCEIRSCRCISGFPAIHSWSHQ